MNGGKICLYLESDGLASESLNEDLHATAKA